MIWRPVDIKEPPTATHASDVADPVLDQTPAELAGARSRLAAVGSRTRFVPSPLASQAGDITVRRARLDELLYRGALALSVTPWTHGVAGQVDGQPATHGWISPQQAVASLAGKLLDGVDRRNCCVGECLAVLVIADSYQSLFDRLVTLNTLLPLPGLFFAEQRALQLVRMMSDQWERHSPPLAPRWQNRRNLQNLTAQALRTALGPVLADVEQYATDDDPVAELQDLLVRRTDLLDQRRRSWARFRQQLNGGTGLAIFIQGDPASIAQSLDESTLNLPGANLSVIGALAGEPGSLAFFREILGL